MLREREREEPGATFTKVITPGKIVPFDYCLPTWNISVTKDVFLNLCCHTFSLLSLTFIEYGQHVNKHSIDEAVLGENGRVYATDEAEIDKGQ